MSDTQKKIEEMFKSARLNRDHFGVETFNMLRAQIKNARIEKMSDLTEEDVVKVVKRECKQLNESMEAFKVSGSEEGYKESEKRFRLIEPLLPEEISEDKIVSIVDEVLSSVKDRSNFGPIMGQVMSRLKGQNVDGKKVREILQRRI
tara:strand:+ start:1752 stop:2192 length:441 start_codon:yes stop_codon:yes gene_type:complete